MDLTNKEKYSGFCKNVYVPIYSKPWWLDAICGENNWDVWLYERDNKILAAMPYYVEKRGDYLYITKAPLTQNNGIIFDYTNKRLSKVASFQEKVIDEACKFIESLNVDVYEQQYMHTFNNYSPFYWNGYSAILRYTYIISDTKNMDIIWDNFTPEIRNIIRKGQKLTRIVENFDPKLFYKEHERIYLKQDLHCPFSEDLWLRLYYACKQNNSGKILFAYDAENNINALMYLIWDEKSVYLLMGGAMPEFSKNQAYAALIYQGIELAHEKGLSFDFEGSMIKRIAKSYREYGGEPFPYYRIRKVFNPTIIINEANIVISNLEG